MSSKAALRHEDTATHRRCSAPAHDAWNTAVDFVTLYDLKATEKMQHVDSLKDLIPFWQQQMEAANRGVELRFADFLDSLASTHVEEPSWDLPLPDWAVKPIESNSSQSVQEYQCSVHDRMRIDSVKQVIDAQSSSVSDERCDASSEVHRFVEEIARMESTSDERRQRMYSFYKVCYLSIYVRSLTFAITDTYEREVG